jgi:hypothetical protein
VEESLPAAPVRCSTGRGWEAAGGARCGFWIGFGWERPRRDEKIGKSGPPFSLGGGTRGK